MVVAVGDLFATRGLGATRRQFFKRSCETKNPGLGCSQRKLLKKKQVSKRRAKLLLFNRSHSYSQKVRVPAGLFFFKRAPALTPENCGAISSPLWRSASSGASSSLSRSLSENSNSIRLEKNTHKRFLWFLIVARIQFGRGRARGRRSVPRYKRASSTRARTRACSTFRCSLRRSSLSLFSAL